MSGYWLHPCVMLLANVFANGTRRQFYAAQRLKEAAENADANRAALMNFSSRQVADLEEKPRQRKTSGNRVGRPRQKETKKETI
jgi:hypothetical protein